MNTLIQRVSQQYDIPVREIQKDKYGFLFVTCQDENGYDKEVLLADNKGRVL